MKLIRFGPPQQEKTGVIINDEYFDTSSFGEAYDERFFGSNGLQRLQAFVRQQQGRLPQIPKDTRLGCPFARPSKIVCIGLNYADHARETHAAIPTEPIIFFKSTTAITGPND